MNTSKMVSLISNLAIKCISIDSNLSTDLYAENDDDDNVDCQEEYEVIEIAPNRYKTTFHVPQ